MLRRAYKTKDKTPELARQLARTEVGKKFWGSRGSYMKQVFLQTFVDAMGHEYEDLMDEYAEVEMQKNQKQDKNKKDEEEVMRPFGSDSRKQGNHS